MLKHMTILVASLYYLVKGEPPVQGVKPINVMSSSDYSFSFTRPGLTQTSYAFSGPHSHQSFSSTIGDPQLAQKVLPSVAHSFAYRDTGLGYYPITNGYGASSTFASPATEPLAYQTTVDPAMALAYMQQQQPAYFQGYQPNVAYQAQLAQLYASRQAQIQQLQAIQSQPVLQQAQLQLQQEE